MNFINCYTVFSLHCSLPVWISHGSVIWLPVRFPNVCGSVSEKTKSVLKCVVPSICTPSLLSSLWHLLRPWCLKCALFYQMLIPVILCIWKNRPRSPMKYKIKPMEHCPSWQANSCWAILERPYSLWNPLWELEISFGHMPGAHRPVCQWQTGHS